MEEATSYASQWATTSLVLKNPPNSVRIEPAVTDANAVITLYVALLRPVGDITDWRLKGLSILRESRIIHDARDACYFSFLTTDHWPWVRLIMTNAAPTPWQNVHVASEPLKSERK